MVRLDDDRKAAATDATSANILINFLNGTQKDLGNIQMATIIVAPDDSVVSVARSVTGAPDYDFIPEFPFGDGVNSNAAPLFIATQSAELAGNAFTLRDHRGIQSGASKKFTDQVKHTELPEKLDDK